MNQSTISFLAFLILFAGVILFAFYWDRKKLRQEKKRKFSFKYFLKITSLPIEAKKVMGKKAYNAYHVKLKEDYNNLRHIKKAK